MEFTFTESAVLNRIQRDFPLTEKPFDEMARELSIGADTMLQTVKDLKAQGVVRNISAIFNPGKLGFVSSLVAFRIDDAVIDDAAIIISAHPGVSHNYRRDHRYNLWFTLSADSEEKLAKTVVILAERAGAKDQLILKNEKLLKIGLVLSIGDDETSCSEAPPVHHGHERGREHMFSEKQKEAVRLLQIDMPLEGRPFKSIITTASGRLSEPDLIEQARSFRNAGILRRYAAVLRHRKAGYQSNAMTVWKPRHGSDLNRIIEYFRAEPKISHLYLRTVYPGRWQYPLFAMIHTRTDPELDNVISRLATGSDISDYLVLRSLKEYKKERVVYYSPAFREWERQAGL
ncbi:MAG TPA: hypothetical protein PKI31_15865 [Spirochaetota bacterium]|nr:hypothetical protein [Spirochaetota bacterium]